MARHSDYNEQYTRYYETLQEILKSRRQQREKEATKPKIIVYPERDDEEINFDVLPWKPQYDKKKLSFNVKEVGGVDRLFVSVDGFYTASYNAQAVYINAGIMKNNDDIDSVCRLIFEYLINNALFPYPVEEI